MKIKEKSAFSRLIEFAKDAKSKVISSIILAVLGVLIGMIPYVCLAKLVSAFYTKEVTLEFVVIWSLVSIVAVIIKMLFTTLSTMKSHEAAFIILKNIRLKLTNKMQKLPMGVMTETPSGTLKTMVVDAVDKIEKPLAHVLPEMAANLFAPFMIMVVIFVINWKMGIASIITLPIGFLINMGQMIGYKEKSENYYKANSSMNDAIVEYVNGIQVIKAFNQSDSSYAKFTNACKYYRDFTLSWWKGCWVYSAIGNSIVSSTLVVTLPYGAYLFMNNELSFSTFIMCVILSMGISGPIMAAMGFVDSLANIIEAIKIVGNFLDKEELIRPNKRAKLTKEAFEFKNVSFGYNDKEILHNINLKVVTKGMTAIVGPSGGGKSTIAKLMAGFWETKSGEIILGGKSLKQIPFEQLMENISFVTQDNYLFDISLMENIRIGNTNATDEDVIKAAKAAGCHEFILKLNEQYNTKVGDAGGKLSGGERQRITIARAILKNSPIVILDEATAYADPENEEQIQKAIAKLVKGKTLIVIAHRLSTIVNSDKIIVINKGEVLSEGKHQELLKNCQLYNLMWKNHIGEMEKEEVA